MLRLKAVVSLEGREGDIECLVGVRLPDRVHRNPVGRLHALHMYETAVLQSAAAAAERPGSSSRRQLHLAVIESSAGIVRVVEGSLGHK